MFIRLDQRTIYENYRLKKKKIMGRPATKPTELREGYYIEVRNKNQKTGIKLYRETKKQLLMAIEEYEKTKDVVVLGKLENGKMKEIPDLKKG